MSELPGKLPDKLYCVDSVVQLEQIAIKQYDIPAYELMKRAGRAVFDVITERYPSYHKLLVLCGAGNNAGDGYVVATLAQQAGFDVRVISLVEPASLKGEARLACDDWLQVGRIIDADPSQLDEPALIVDALLGTGLSRPLSADWLRWIQAVNTAKNPVVAVDVPSGLLADTGAIAGGQAGAAINADVTVCFIALKQGMFTAQAGDVCGEIVFSDLGVPPAAYQQLEPDARMLSEIDESLLTGRKASSHKGRFGHVLIVGGNAGMPGAVILAARAALRSGAGLVTVLTIPQHLSAVSCALPEVMIKTCVSDVAGDTESTMLTVTELFAKSDFDTISHVAVGMGLGRDEWSVAVLQQCLRLRKPALLDADALNLLAERRELLSLCEQCPALIVTPHPGEAARLLSTGNAVSTMDVQNDRFAALTALQDKFAVAQACVVVLKGYGTLIADGEKIDLCHRGNAAMAVPGMGDVLSGIMIALMAQFSRDDLCAGELAAQAVCLHACAAERASGGRTRGLLASDVIEQLPELMS